MRPPGATTVLVRYGDVGVKSPPVRHRMEQQLRSNIAALLEDRAIEGSVEAHGSRIWIQTEADGVERATAAATDAFGVVSASPAVAVPATLDAILETLASTAEAVYREGSFAVRARRAGPSEAHPFSSSDIERAGGDVIWERVAERFEPTVDLEDPDTTFFVECRREQAYVFLEKHGGPGGLPVGSQQPLVALVSGGIDSPVAAWLAMKRGSPVVPVYFDFEEYGGPDHVARAEAAIDTLAGFAPNLDLRPRIAPAGAAATTLLEAVDGTRMLSLRRFMLRVATALAQEVGAAGIVVGEALGQKSSQTAANMATTDPITALPIHRPLLGYDKQEIIALAKRIGTYEEATIPAGCNRLAPDRPATAATLEAVEAAEPDLEALVSQTVEQLHIRDDDAGGLAS